MKKLLISSLKVIVLGFSVILEGGCGNSPLDINFSAGPKTDTSRRHLRWRIDSLMQSHFAADGPGVVLDAELEAPDRSFDTSTMAKGFSRGGYSFWTGLSDITGNEKITDSSVFNIGSLTKQFTARAVMMSTDRISLSEPIGKYLTGLKPAIAALTISQLLSHCSGIPDHYGYTDTNKVKHATDRDVLNAVRKADQLYFPAGTHYRYSNTAYCLLGMMLEKLSGSSYDSAARRAIDFTLDSNGDRRTGLSFLLPSAEIGNRVHGYEKNKTGQWVEADAPESIFFTTQADGGALISMNDYMEWCRALVSRYQDGVPLPEFERHTLVDTAAGLYYGYGWFVLPRKGTDGPLIYHTGFNGGFRTSVLLIPAIGYRIAIFSASPGVDLEDLVHQINLILGVDDKGFIKSGPLES